MTWSDQSTHHGNRSHSSFAHHCIPSAWSALCLAHKYFWDYLLNQWGKRYLITSSYRENRLNLHNSGFREASYRVIIERGSELPGQGGISKWIWEAFRRQSTGLGGWSRMRLGDAQMFSLGTEEGASASNPHREPGGQADSDKLISIDWEGWILSTLSWDT